jgi:hypothetical protein
LAVPDKRSQSAAARPCLSCHCRAVMRGAGNDADAAMSVTLQRFQVQASKGLQQANPAEALAFARDRATRRVVKLVLVPWSARNAPSVVLVRAGGYQDGACPGTSPGRLTSRHMFA